VPVKALKPYDMSRVWANLGVRFRMHMAYEKSGVSYPCLRPMPLTPRCVRTGRGDTVLWLLPIKGPTVSAVECFRGLFVRRSGVTGIWVPLYLHVLTYGPLDV
jgi:hypothetical protein